MYLDTVLVHLFEHLMLEKIIWIAYEGTSNTVNAIVHIYWSTCEWKKIQTTQIKAQHKLKRREKNP